MLYRATEDSKAITVWRKKMQRHLIWSEGFRDFCRLRMDVLSSLSEQELSLRRRRR